MVELNDIEMKEVDPSNGSNSTTTATTTVTTSKDEKKDANTLTLDGQLKLLFLFFLKNSTCFFYRYQRTSSNNRKSR